MELLWAILTQRLLEKNLFIELNCCISMKNVKLDLPRYKNFNNYSCFVTTVAMILKYYGKRINQKEIFEKAKVYDPNDKTRCIGSTVPSVILALKNEGYKMIAWHDKVKKDIKKGGPEMEKFYKVWDKGIKEAEKFGILDSYKKVKKQFIIYDNDIFFSQLKKKNY